MYTYIYMWMAHSCVMPHTLSIEYLKRFHRCRHGRKRVSIVALKTFLPTIIMPKKNTYIQICSYIFIYIGDI